MRTHRLTVRSCAYLTLVCSAITEDPTNGARDETADRDPGPGAAAGSH